MGRKIKSIVALIIVLGMIYWQQLSIVGAAYAETGSEKGEMKNNSLGEKMEEDNSGDKKPLDRGAEEKEPEDGGTGDKKPLDSGTEEKEPEDGGTGEKEPGDSGTEEKEPGDGGTEEKEPEGGPQEPIKCFEITFTREDGKNGYYVSKPEAEICHVSKRGVTRYSFTDGDGKNEEGELSECNDKIQIEKARFKEGVNHLSIWMEDEKGGSVEENVFDKSFIVDTKAPVVRIQSPHGADQWYQEEAFISVSGEDGERGSQIDEIICFQGKQEIGRSQKSSAGYRITLASAGGKPVPVTVRVRDKAGNLTEEKVGLYIDSHPPKASIEGIEPYMITSQPVELNYHVEDENGIEKMNAAVSREDPEGEITLLEVKDWNITEMGGDACQTLTEDGIYRLKVEVFDKAGYGDESTGQVMIDKENPVICSVDRFEGKYMKNFCWNEPIEEVIQDFTSYTYSVYLDGKPYHMGENITREGGHILEVQAVDSAGNEGVAKAEFVIDHTAPEVVFTDVEEEGRYEKEHTFQVSLKNPEDYIKEIRINGERQAVDPKEKRNQYHVQECEDYEVLVKAGDQAGNVTTARINFEVVPEETLVQKVYTPIKKALLGPFQSGKKEQTMEAAGQGEKRTFPAAALFIIGAAAIGGGTSYYMLKKWL